mmetsp:Transcript_1178/g.2485  ORF Transcript_1178/g.2485 Transcript_1178/m.2485 type:complete len:964 (-) Transcript_1178:109-3000(-)
MCTLTKHKNNCHVPSPSLASPKVMASSSASMRTRRCNKSSISSKTQSMSLTVLLLMMGSSFVTWNTNLFKQNPNGILLASAFTPCSITQNHAQAHKITINANDGSMDVNNRMWTTALFAQKKNGGKKVPKMPTLPVSTPSSTASSEEDDFYSSSKPTSTSTMVVMDVENIRGATSFRISHEALLTRIRLWREDRLSMALEGPSGDGGAAFLEPLVWICDHGMAPSIHHWSLFGANDDTNMVQMPHNFGAVFAGPGRPADDVIVDLVEARCGGRSNTISNDDDLESPSEPQAIDSSTRNNTIVITADARLISRCQQARRKSSSLSDVIFVEPTSLLQQLEKYRTNSNEEESLFGERATSLTMSPPVRRKTMDDNNRREDGKTNTMSSFKKSTIGMEQHAKFQARFQNKNDDDTAEAKEEPSNDAKEEEAQSQRDINDANSAAMAAQLKTEQIRRQLILSDAYYLARPSKSARGRRAQSTSAAVHAKYQNRNISKKQQKKLYQKRFGTKRKEDMVVAAMTRKELAAKLQLNLERANPDSREEDYGKVNSVEDENEMLVRSMRLLETLLGKFEGERLTGKLSSSPLTSSVSSDPTTSLGLDSAAGRIGLDDKWDPLGSTLNVPLREDLQNNDQSLPPLRIVVISDTHGFEGALAKFDDSSQLQSDEFLLPQADVLLHCGDFAASGSRKMQRLAARRLDDFLARQTHIPEKIVIKGNHDPDSPAKVLFPGSKALYVRSSSTLMVNGVSFTLEPFSRRMAFRSIRKRTSSYGVSSLPKCDILVTHEPPKGVLDLTYHGFSAGSHYLKELVEHSEHKPRLWLCGHIHESRGVMTKEFHPMGQQNGDKSDEDSEDASTMVINASNANSGRANRLVSGAIVVDIARHPSNTGGDETAVSTLQSRKADDFIDGFTESVNGARDDAALAGLGEELELYVTRPGVRKRKGLPQSVRQQMKQFRSTLVTSESNEE